MNKGYGLKYMIGGGPRMTDIGILDPRKTGFLTEDFRFFHLRDEKSPSYPFHYHDFLKIVVLLGGKVRYVIEGRAYTLHPYDIVLVNRGQIHRAEVEEGYPYERMILYLSTGFLNRFSEPEHRLEQCFDTAAYRHSSVLRLDKDGRGRILSLLLKLEQAENEKRKMQKEFASPLLCRLLCLEFLVELNRLSIRDQAQYLATGILDYRVSALLAYIGDHLGEDLSISALSAVSCLSPYHMMRIFKEETGYTIGAYVTEKRLLHAKDLLSQGQSATDACFQSGFSHYSTFLKAYKQHFHCLPKRRGKSLSGEAKMDPSGSSAGPTGQ